MAGSAAGARPSRRGPAPIASFDHDGSDESTPETKQSFRLPEIREDGAGGGGGLAPPEQRARSHSTPALGAGAAPRIDISRASSSSHHDSRDSSPEMALFAGHDSRAAHLGFREDGALDLRSSTEELAFLEPAPSAPPAAPPPAPPAAPPAPPPAPERRHSRKDSQGSEAALLAVSGRTSRLSSIGSQCSAQSALSGLSRVSRLSAVSGVSRSPSPHRMLLETSFCGPKPIETDPEVGAGILVEQILGIAKSVEAETAPPAAGAVDARDRREVRTEATVESARAPPLTPAVTVVAPPPHPAPPPPDEAPLLCPKDDKEFKNHTRPEERKARPRLRREPSEPEVYKSRNKTKNIIRIKLKPDDSYEEEEESERAGAGEGARKPATLELGRTARPADTAPAAQPAPPSPALSRRRSPSPSGPPVSRKSSFCSLFKSRETIASPESPSGALRRKRSLTEGRSRSKSRDRSATPTSASKIRGSVLSLFRAPRRSGAATSPGSREASPGAAARSPATAPPPDRRRADKLKYYDAAADGIIHIPLRTPPDERPAAPRRNSGADAAAAADAAREPRPASAPQPRQPPDRPGPAETQAPPKPDRSPARPAATAPVRQEPISRIESEQRPPSSRAPTKPIHRTVLPDGSIIIPLHSPTELSPATCSRGLHREADVPISTAKAKEEVSLPSAILGQIQISDLRAGSPAVEAAPPTQSCAGPAVQAAPTSPTPGPVEPAPTEDTRRRKKERLIFTTHVGSREQVFSTQFSITKTPSVTSEISGSFPSFTEGEESRAPLRDTHIAGYSSPPLGPGPPPDPSPPRGPGPPPDPARDSSESEPSSEAASSRAGNDVERRGLVVAESFEEELPYVPTTLPQERPVALPMVPVRERGHVRVSGVRRPRAPPPAAPPTAPPCTSPPPAPAAPPPDKLRIKLPRRPRAAPPAADADRPRTRSGGDSGGESRSKAEWIDFEEVPERRKQPKRIQTLPAGAAGTAAAGGALLSYVAPEHCRCECHAATRHDHHSPLADRDSGGPAACAAEARRARADSPPPP